MRISGKNRPNSPPNGKHPRHPKPRNLRRPMESGTPSMTSHCIKRRSRNRQRYGRTTVPIPSPARRLGAGVIFLAGQAFRRRWFREVPPAPPLEHHEECGKQAHRNCQNPAHKRRVAIERKPQHVRRAFKVSNGDYHLGSTGNESGGRVDPTHIVINNKRRYFVAP